MKSILLSLLLLSGIITGLSAQERGITFFTGSFNEALAKAQSTGPHPQLIFFDCYTSWCGPCKRMATQLFTQPEAGDFFNKNFINIKIDMEKGEGVELAKKYAIAMYPTFLILDKHGKEIGRLAGASLTLNDFIERVKDAMDVTNSADYLKEKYAAAPSYNTALKYLNACYRSNRTDEIREFIGTHFEKFSEYEKANNDIWNFVILSISTPDSKILEYIQNNRMYVDQMIGKEKTDLSLIKAYRRMLSLYFSGKIDLSEQDAREIRQQIQMIRSSDQLSNLLAGIAHLMVQQKEGEIAKIVEPSALSGSLTFLEMRQLEGMLAKASRLPQHILREYREKKIKFLEEQLNLAKRD